MSQRDPAASGKGMEAKESVLEDFPHQSVHSPASIPLPCCFFGALAATFGIASGVLRFRPGIHPALFIDIPPIPQVESRLLEAHDTIGNIQRRL